MGGDAGEPSRVGSAPAAASQPLRLKSEAFVLVRYPLTESSWIVSLFTREEGRLRVVAKGARRTKSSFRGALETMNRVRVEVTSREGSDLGNLVGAELEEGAMDLFSRWPAASVLLAMAEVLERGLAELHREEETFRLTEALLRGLRVGLDAPAAWAYFLVWFLKLHGVMPKPDQCVGCGGPPRPLHFDAGAGGWLCPSCRTGRPPQGVDLPRDAEDALQAIFISSPERFAQVEAAPAALGRVRELATLALCAYLGRPLAAAPSL